MKRPRGRYHHGSLATDAIAATALEVDAHGHQGFTLGRVAKRLGVTPAALYRHFDSREALLKAFTWETFLRFGEAMDREVGAAPTPRESLLAMARVMVRFALGNPGWFRLQFSRAGIALGLEHESAGLKYPAAMLTAIGALIGTNDSKAVTNVYLTNWGLVHGVASLLLENVWSDARTDEERLALAEELCAGYVDSLGMRAAIKAAPKGKKRPAAARKKRSAR